MSEPDIKRGYYYVTAIDGPRVAWLAGPFRNDHDRALGLVAPARKLAQDLDPRAHWYAYGTARLEGNPQRMPRGKLNEQLLGGDA